MKRLRWLFAGMVLATLTGCFETSLPGQPDPTALGHAKWCEQSPPSGYCSVGEPH